MQAFGVLSKNKLHIRSQRKADREVALGSKGFEEEKGTSKTDDELVLSERQNKILRLSQRNTVDLTKRKVSLLKNAHGSFKKEEGNDMPM